MEETTILECQGFRHSSSNIPAFQLSLGGIARIYIPMISKYRGRVKYDLENDLVDFLIQKRPIQGLKVDTTMLRASHISTLSLKNRILPPTIESYLKREKCTHPAILALVRQYIPNPLDTKLNEVGQVHKRMLSIISCLVKSDVVIFNYFGLSPVEVEELNAFLLEVVTQNKAAIGFDSLPYLTEEETNSKIQRIIVEEFGQLARR
ncbi:MAG: hypothetical protein NWR72_01400 [Bacteroidia bacterium]|nr:hypothetical protein [Bacteroidia bacterium]